MKSISLIILFGVVIGLATEVASEDECSQQIEEAKKDKLLEIAQKQEELENEVETAKQELEAYQEPIDKLESMKNEMDKNLKILNDWNEEVAKANENLKYLESLEKEINDYKEQIKALEKENGGSAKDLEEAKEKHRQNVEKLETEANEKLKQLKAEAAEAWTKQKDQLDAEYNTLIKNMDAAQKTRDDLRAKREQNFIQRLESLSIENANLKYQVAMCRRG